MATTTETEVDTDSLEDLDFQHICQTSRRSFAMDTFLDWVKCGAPAHWLHVLPCCGHQAFLCNPCHDDAHTPVLCAGCGANHGDSLHFAKYRI